MLSPQTPTTGTSTHDENTDYDHEEHDIRDIHALTPPQPPPRRWSETGNSHHNQSYSMSSEGGASSENFTTMSREFNALVLAGSAVGSSSSSNTNNAGAGGGGGRSGGSDHRSNDVDVNRSAMLTRIGEDDDVAEETNPLAIVPDNNIFDPNSRRVVGSVGGGEVTVQRVKKEEVEMKISAWQNAKIAKINNRFKREDAIINGWESEQIQKANSWMKKVERKLEEKRARAMEKMENEVAKAHRKAEERRASAEAKRGTKVAKVLQLSNFMKAVGRPPAKRSFF